MTRVIDLWTWPLVGLLFIGLFLAGGVLASPGRGPERAWLAVLLASAASFAGEFAMMRAGMYRPPVLFPAYPLFFLIGPAAWFTVRGLGGERIPFRRAWPHLVPVALAALDLAPYYRDILAAGGAPEHGGRTVSGIGPYGQCLIQLAHTGAYAVLGSRALRPVEATARDVHSGDAIYRVRTAQRLCRSLWLVIGIEIVAFLAMMLSRRHVDSAEYVMGFAVAALVVALGWSVLQTPALPVAAGGSGKYRRSAMAEGELEVLATRLAALVEADRLWLQPDLTLGELSERAGLARHDVSQVLSRGLGVTFYAFVNSYRVREAARQLLDDPGDKTMLAVAYDSGFASKASFNRVFKDTLGMTPSQFRASGSLDHPALRGRSSRPVVAA